MTQQAGRLLFFGVVLVAITLFILWAVWIIPKDDVTVTIQATKDALPGSVNVVCLEGHEYFYIERTGLRGESRAVMAPKFDEEGRPAKCRAEKQP